MILQRRNQMRMKSSIIKKRKQKQRVIMNMKIIQVLQNKKRAFFVKLKMCMEVKQKKTVTEPVDIMIKRNHY